MVAAFSRFFCGLRGHDALLHFEDKRISLKCTSCTWESPGWDCRPTSKPVTTEPYSNLTLVRSDVRRIA